MTENEPLTPAQEEMRPGATALIRDLVIHLRLHFQLLLAPIYLWGFYLADGRIDLAFGLGFLAFHLFLYGGTTAYNSYYDRDEGPVGGLEKPPPVTELLLPFSWGMQLMGVLLAAFVNLPLLVLYLVIMGMGIAYSHPRTRWKARPFGGLLTVGVGQGILAGLAGWVTAQPDLLQMRWIDGLGILAIALVTVGFYPLTQIYQIEEDAARGDITFAVWAGSRGVFRFAIPLLAGAAILLIGVIVLTMGWWAGLLVGAVYVWLLVALLRWASQYDEQDVLANFRYIMRIYQISSGGFLLLLCLHLFWLI